MLIIKVHVKKGHSCKTLLLKVVNDILWVLECQELNTMLLLHLNTAFDMVDHQLLISLLENKYGIHDRTLLWYQHYLRDHWFKVPVDGSFSSAKIIKFLVLQGSLLGPVLFNCYCLTLQGIIKVEVLLLYSATRPDSFNSTLQPYPWQGTHPTLV